MPDSNGDGRKVLVVEDDRGIRDLLIALLGRDGYVVDSVADGEQAIIALGTSQYDAILLDLMLPRADGYDVIHHVATKGPRIPIVVATAAVKSIKRDRIDPQIVVSIIRKPFDLSDVREALFSATHRQD
jgi:two-component system, OmpR family, response regulator